MLQIGVVCRPPRTTGSDVHFPFPIFVVLGWMGSYVLFHDLPLDIYHLVLLRCHGICLGRLNVHGNHFGSRLSLELRQGPRSLS